VFVRDAIQDGDEMIILTSAGQIPTNVFQNYFVKVSEEEYSAASIGVSKEVKGDELVQKINQGLDSGLQITKRNDEPEITLDTPIGGPSPKQETQSVSTAKIELKNEQSMEPVKSETQNSNFDLINKVFEKHKTEPTIDFNINIDEWPVEQLKMLINVFDISVDEISEYIIEHYLNQNELKTNLSMYLENELNK
jgi:hypothetical protein